MAHTKGRLVLLAVLAVAGWCVAVPASADAFVSYYNCVNKPISQLCDGRANGSFDGLHSWDYNQASYSGGGSVRVCQAVIHLSSGIWLNGSSCSSGSQNYTSHVYGNITCACYEANIYHETAGSYSINGFADAAY